MDESFREKLKIGEAHRPEFGGIWLNPKSHTVEAEGTSNVESLGKAEYLILWLLIRAKGESISSEQITEFLKEHSSSGKHSDAPKINPSIMPYVTRLRNTLSFLTNGRVTIPYANDVDSGHRGYRLQVNENTIPVRSTLLTQHEERSETLDTLLAKLEPGALRASEWGPLSLNLSGNALHMTGTSESATLAPSEYQVLWLLMRANGATISQKEMVEFLYQDAPVNGEEPDLRAIDVKISAVRHIVEKISGGTVTIQNRRGFGYRIANA